MDDLHLRLIRLGLDALGDDFGFALAGGYAVQAHHIVQRLSDDVDLFAPIERRGEMPAATDRLVGVLSEHGYRVEVLQRAETYVRLMVTDPVSGHDTKVELVAEFLQHPVVGSEWGPVLHQDDVAAGKMEALFSRAEARDFIDVDALVRAGYTRERLIELAAERDAGFDRGVLAQMFAGADRFSDRQFLVYGVDQAHSRRHPGPVRGLAAGTAGITCCRKLGAVGGGADVFRVVLIHAVTGGSARSATLLADSASQA